MYIQKAYRYYKKWGAEAKLFQLEENYSNIFLSKKFKHKSIDSASISPSSFAFRSNSMDSSPNDLNFGDFSSIDVASIIKASSISYCYTNNRSEVLQQLTKIAAENSGAQFAYLLLVEKKDRTTIVANYNTDDRSENQKIFQPTLLENCSEEISRAIVNYVQKTRKTLVSLLFSIHFFM